MSLFDPIWAADGEISVPSEAQIRTGFTCGPVSPGLFNYVIQTLETTINGLGIDNMVPLSRRVDTAEGVTGGGELDQNRTLRLDFANLEPEDSVASDDLIAVYKQGAQKHVHMLREDFIAGLGGEGGDISGGANIGTGTGDVFASVSGSNLQFRRLLNAGGLDIAVADDDVTLALADMGADLTAI